MDRDDRDTWPDDEEITREDGILFSRSGHREVGCEGACASDDYIADPINDDGVPGTVDDLPYDYGLETSPAADQLLESIERAPASSWGVGRTGHPEEGDEPPPGKPEERELWELQLPLIEEAEAEEKHVAGLREEDIPAVADASAEDAAEVLPDAPDGTSATAD